MYTQIVHPCFLGKLHFSCRKKGCTKERDGTTLQTADKRGWGNFKLLRLGSNCYDRLFIVKGKFGKVTLVLPFIAKCLLQLDNSMQKLSMRQTLFPHLIRPNLSCFYYNSNLFFGRNDSTNFYHFFGQFL